jgi:hypothetical protein
MGATSLSQWGITWTFKGEYTTGQFVNGDYYVVANTDYGSDPNVLIIHIDPCCSSTESGRTQNGAMFDPNAGEAGENISNTKHGFDSAIAAYQASLNKALPGDANITSSNPLVVPAGTSLVSCESDPDSPYRPLDFAILTVVSSAPDANSFRPAYAASSKTIDYNLADVNYDVLADLTEQAGAPSMSDLIDGAGTSNFKYPYICISNTNAILQGVHHSIHDDFCEDSYDAWLLLNCNYTDAQKKDLLIYMIQVGIDVYGIVGRNVGGRQQFRAFGAYNVGKKTAIMAAYAVLEDTTVLADITAKSGDYIHSETTLGTWPVAQVPADAYYFSEDVGTFLLASWHRQEPPYAVYNTAILEDSGTVSVTNGSYYVNGTDCNFLDAKDPDFLEWADNSICLEADPCGFQKGAWFIVDGDSEASDPLGRPYNIADFNSTTLLTLQRPYEGSTDSGLSYRIATQIFYGYGATGVSNNCYRGLDFNEPPEADLNWPQFNIGYLGGQQSAPSVRSLDNRAEADAAGGYYVNNCRCYGGQQLVMLIMGLKDEWDHDVFFDFTDWYIAEARDNGVADFQGAFCENMWDEYRTDYGALYDGPDAAVEETLKYLIARASKLGAWTP